eukprot:jgi/Chlat1/8124/Chrsp75S07558
MQGDVESKEQLYDRCVRALEDIAAKHYGGTAVVVAHGGVLNVLYKRATGKNFPGKIVNAAVNTLLVCKSGEWEVLEWGSTDHLKDSGFLVTAFGGESGSG